MTIAKLRSPIIAPTTNRPRYPRSRLFTAAIVGPYMPTASKKKEPETPGRTSAQTAKPANSTICQATGLSRPAFGREVSQKAAIAPRIRMAEVN